MEKNTKNHWRFYIPCIFIITFIVSVFSAQPLQVFAQQEIESLEDAEIPLYSGLLWRPGIIMNKTSFLPDDETESEVKGYLYRSIPFSTNGKPSKDLYEYYFPDKMGAFGWQHIQYVDSFGSMEIQYYREIDHRFLTLTFRDCQASELETNSIINFPFCLDLWFSESGQHYSKPIPQNPAENRSIIPDFETITYSNPLPVPFLSQRNSDPNNNITLGFGTSCSGITIHDYGCVLTSYAMLYNYYQSGYTTVVGLNDLMKVAPGVYSSNGAGCYSLWPVSAPDAPSGVTFGTRYTNASTTPNTIDPANVTIIDNELNAGRPLHARVHAGGTYTNPTHSILIIGHSGNTYYIRDPYSTTDVQRTLTSGSAASTYTVDYIDTINGTPPGSSGTDNATFITQSTYPLVSPGQSFQIYFEVRNTGTTTWQPGSYWLQNIQYPLGANSQQALSSSVSPNGTFRWTINQTAPSTPGTYRSQWMISHNGTHFGPNMFIDVTVQSGPPAADHSVQFYKDWHYELGYCYGDNAGNYMSLDGCSGYDENISSLILKSGWSVRVFKNRDLGNPSKCFTANDDDFSNNSFDDGSTLNDQMSSFVLYNNSSCTPPLPGSFNKSSPGNGTTGGSTSPTLSWDSSSGATNYDFCYDTTNDNACSNWTSNGPALSKALSGLSAGTTYYWHVRATNSGGTTYSNGSSTAFWSYTTAVNPPGSFNKSSPSSGTTGGSTSPTLIWAASSGATNYDYCYDTTNDNACSNWTSNGTSTSKALSGLSAGTTYYWHVRATNSAGTTYSNGNSTAFWSYTTAVNPPGSFNKSSPSSGTTGGSTSPTLIWAASSGATNYDYCYDTTNDNACSNWTSNGASTSKALSGLSSGTTYYWHVRATNSGGTTYSNGSSTAFWSFTTVLPLPTPEITSVEPASKQAGSGSFSLVVFGNNLTSNSHIFWNGIELPTTYFGNWLTATINSSLITKVVIADITVDGSFSHKPFYVYTFADVTHTHPLWRYVEGFFAKGITTGCAVNPLKYCPDRNVTRGEMAVFILRAKDGLVTPNPLNGNIFSDVPSPGKDWMQPWIEEFYEQGITTGCATDPLRYCPERYVTRGEMAIFILRAQYGSNYSPPPAKGIFVDVPDSNWMKPWIERLYALGITTGCGGSIDTHDLKYCPDRNVNRAEMATFVDRAFGFPQLP